MWIFCKHGFFSIVETREIDDKHSDQPIAIRARIHEDLVRLKQAVGFNGTIVSLSGRDYPYRVYVSRDVLADVMMNLADTLDYNNFKSMVTAAFNFARHELYMKVWGVMYQAEDKLIKESDDDVNLFRRGPFRFSRETDAQSEPGKTPARRRRGSSAPEVSYKRESVVPGAKSSRVIRDGGDKP